MDISQRPNRHDGSQFMRLRIVAIHAPSSCSVSVEALFAGWGYASLDRPPMMTPRAVSASGARTMTCSPSAGGSQMRGPGNVVDRYDHFFARKIANKALGVIVGHSGHHARGEARAHSCRNGFYKYRHTLC